MTESQKGTELIVREEDDQMLQRFEQSLPQPLGPTTRNRLASLGLTEHELNGIAVICADHPNRMHRVLTMLEEEDRSIDDISGLYKLRENIEDGYAMAEGKLDISLRSLADLTDAFNELDPTNEGVAEFVVDTYNRIEGRRFQKYLSTIVDRIIDIRKRFPEIASLDAIADVLVNECTLRWGEVNRDDENYSDEVGLNDDGWKPTRSVQRRNSRYRKE